MKNVLIQDDGKPLKVQGFANIFGAEAETEAGVETFRPGAFAKSLASGAEIVATWGHCLDFIWASTADGSLQLWETDVGLAFECTIESSMRGLGLANFIAEGHAVASITFNPLELVKTATGRQVTRADLREICIFFEAAYPTAVWLAGDAQPDNLTPRSQGLRRRWIDERQARRTYAKPAARAQRSQTLAAISDEEAFGTPPAGMSMDEWLSFGRSCAHGARWMR
jgi:HK97 family phage prohead protease